MEQSPNTGNELEERKFQKAALILQSRLDEEASMFEAHLDRIRFEVDLSSCIFDQIDLGKFLANHSMIDFLHQMEKASPVQVITVKPIFLYNQRGLLMSFQVQTGAPKPARSTDVIS